MKPASSNSDTVRTPLAEKIFNLHLGDAKKILSNFQPDSIDCIVTSPPYWRLRDYKIDGQIGQEQSPEEYVASLVEVGRILLTVLKPQGTFWLNLGDTYAGAAGRKSRSTGGLKSKDLVGIPWMVAFAMRSLGWHLRSDIIWYKNDPVPESVQDRPTRAHEYIFLLTRSAKYYYDKKAIQEPAAPSTIQRAKYAWAPGNKKAAGYRELNGLNREGNFPLYEFRNKRTVWKVGKRNSSERHFAMFPEKLVEPCILAGCPKGGVVLDPFCGTATVGSASLKHGRYFVGIDLSPPYIEIAEKRLGSFYSLDFTGMFE